jgi:hypothetical protein
LKYKDMRIHKNIRLAYLLMAFIALVFASCSESLLDQQPKGVWHHGNLEDSLLNVDSEVLIEAKVLESYAHLRIWGFSWAYMAMSSISSDDADKGSSPADGGPDMQAFDNYTYNPSNAIIKDAYKTCFTGVVMTNEALALLSTLSDTVMRKEVLTAEARFMRGLYYFRLVRCFGGVSKLSVVLDEEAGVPPRVSADEIYEFIEEDFSYAIEHLPTKADYQATGGIGRATQGAAKGYLAKTYLYQERWGEVLVQTADIIASSSYDLSTPIDKIFTENEENGKESLFEMQAEVTRLWVGI